MYWVESCEGPKIKDFEIYLEVRPDVKAKAAQPFNLSEYDQLRVDYFVAEECRLNKRRMYDPMKHGLPEWTCALSMVDQRGKGILGRMACAYGPFNDASVGTFAPAADVEGAFRSTR